jgi:FimV-like protein
MNFRSTFAWIALVALVSGCQTTSVRSAWFDTDFSGPPMRKIVVAGSVNRTADERVLEDIFVEKLRAAGVEAVAGHTVRLDVPALPDAEPITVTNTELSKDADVAEKLKGLDFEFDDVSALTPQAEVPASPVAEHPKVDDVLPTLDFEFGQAAGEPVTDITATAKGAGDEFAETKLELAAAYLDMGDPVGARSLLEEVLQEGNVEQRQRAKTYMEQLG